MCKLRLQPRRLLSRPATPARSSCPSASTSVFWKSRSASSKKSPLSSICWQTSLSSAPQATTPWRSRSSSRSRFSRPKACGPLWHFSPPVSRCARSRSSATATRSAPRLQRQQPPPRAPLRRRRPWRSMKTELWASRAHRTLS
eukprot:Amastigsp_a2072_14.p4 type:complete len:143 gc:universal Amastigsp_a2072_14:136-564(+)